MLPITRDTTYAAAAQVKSADLNAIQDAQGHVRPHFLDDFFYKSTRWEYTVDNDGNITEPAGGNDTHLLNVVSGTANNNVSKMRTKTRLTRLVDLPAFRARVRFGKGATPVTSNRTVIGLVRASDPNALDLAFYRDTAAGSNPNTIKLLFTDGAGAQLVVTGVDPAADLWYVLEVVVVSLTSVAWRVANSETGAALASGTFAATTITGTEQLIFSCECKSLSAASRSLGVDYVSVRAAREAT
jgi:hypothetical protein